MLIRIDLTTGCVCKLVSFRAEEITECEKGFTLDHKKQLLHFDHYESLIRFVNEHDVHLCDECFGGNNES